MCGCGCVYLGDCLLVCVEWWFLSVSVCVSVETEVCSCVILNVWSCECECDCGCGLCAFEKLCLCAFVSLLAYVFMLFASKSCPSGK